MDRLPPEILSLICEYGHMHGTERLSVSNYTLVNKDWCKAASRILFRHIHFQICEPEILLQDAHRWSTTLRNRSSLAQVQQMTVRGYMRNDVSPEVYEAALNEHWAPLAALIKRLSGLVHVQCSDLDQLPPSLLTAIHEHPNPQLRFSVEVLHSFDEENFDSHELAILTSPRLSGITARCSAAQTDLVATAISRMVSGLTPDLQDVDLTFVRTRATARRTTTSSSPTLLHDDSGLNKMSSSSGKGHLKSLRLAGASTLRKEDLDAWQARTDFSLLQSLGLRLRAIEWQSWQHLIDTRPFARLKHLSVADSDLPGETSSLTQYFMESIPLLSSLSLIDCPEVLLSAALDRHGSSLQALSIQHSCSSLKPVQQRRNEISQLQHLCPNLQYLKLIVKRTQSDADEAAIYRALGGLSNIQSLHLDLDAAVDITDSDDTQSPPDDTPFNFPGNILPGATHGHVRASFINSALDEALARSIFQEVVKGKPPGSARLLNMELRVVRAGYFGHPASLYSMTKVVNEIARSWQIMSNPRDDMPEQLLVKPLRALQVARDDGMGELDKDVEPIFRRIWPAREGSDGKGWRKDWSSFPLEAH